MKEKHVVTSILKDGNKILILKRSSHVGSFQGCYAGVSGYLEKGETPEERAYKEVEEETGLKKEDIKFIRSGSIVKSKNKNITWVVHPFLFEIGEKKIKLNWEHDTCEWINPKEIEKYRTVPDLDKVLQSVLEG